MMHRLHTRARGFTLIEMLVSVAIFTIIMVIALGALLSLSEADRKAQTLNVSLNNLSSALDSMSRSIRTGNGYNCGSRVGGDCATPPGGTYFAYTTVDGGSVVYCRGTTAGVCDAGGTQILRSDDGGTSFTSMTSPNITITDLQFYVTGSSRSDTIQPKVTILVSGYVVVTPTTNSAFNLQTSVTQRIYDQ